MGFKQFISRIPEVKAPEREVSYREKSFWTLVVFITYLIMTSIPLLGAQVGEGDPFIFMRTITASKHDSLVELGIGPILITGLLTQIFLGFKIIKVDIDDPGERKLFNSIFKVLTILFTVIGALMLLIGGAFGSLEELQLTGQIYIFTQLLAIGIIIIYLDEMIQKGWGFGSGVALYIVGAVSSQIIIGLISIQALLEGPNLVLSNKGILWALYSWIIAEGLPKALATLFFRYSPNPNDHLNLPSYSLLALISTIFIILLLNCLVSITINLENQGIKNNHISNINIMHFLIIPILFTSILFSTSGFIADFVWKISGQNRANLLTNLLGTFEYDDLSRQYIPKTGFAYFLTPPRSLVGDLGVINPYDPIFSFIRVLIYAIAFTTVSTLFVTLMLKSTGFGKLSIRSGGDQVESSINSIIRIWGILVTVIIVISDFFGVFGSGVGLFLCVGILNQYFEIRKNRTDFKSQVMGFYL